MYAASGRGGQYKAVPKEVIKVLGIWVMQGLRSVGRSVPPSDDCILVSRHRRIGGKTSRIGIGATPAKTLLDYLIDLDPCPYL
jgi:hypothetical protein